MLTASSMDSRCGSLRRSPWQHRCEDIAWSSWSCLPQASLAVAGLAGAVGRFDAVCVPDGQI